MYCSVLALTEVQSGVCVVLSSGREFGRQVVDVPEALGDDHCAGLSSLRQATSDEKTNGLGDLGAKKTKITNEPAAQDIN
ncbi:hypothetical protein NDU88_006861 [Pleurodeles waltl]|uniref:Uncharacterized protein n=1 Tax=Pleurodeles waltl TaxID=8319 RepID=A0AAV7WG03_PLEWA|nr:hypothetical protein NDU88_006861 [Pleurodeles waltl]